MVELHQKGFAPAASEAGLFPKDFIKGGDSRSRMGLGSGLQKSEELWKTLGWLVKIVSTDGSFDT